MKKVIISLWVLTLLVASALSSCEWFKTKDPHECESLCTECGGCLNRECEDSACAEKCEGHIPPHECNHTCEECGGCLDAECKEDSCTEKCSCHNRDTLCPECGGCVYTGCKEAICLKKCSCPKCVNVSKELAEELAYEMCMQKPDVTPPYFSIERQINFIKSGYQALLVTFEEVNTYYVGIYYYGDHGFHDPLAYINTCPLEYTFVSFSDVDKIPESYNNKELKAVYVIWEISSVNDIVDENASVPIFSMYDYVSRKNGEIQPPDMPDYGLIYLNGIYNDINAENIYFSKDSYLCNVITITTVIIEGENYAILPTYDERDCGEYYDALSAVVDTEKFYTESQNGKITYWPVVKVSDFAELLKGE